MKTQKYIIITLSLCLVLILVIFLGKSYFSSESIKKQRELDYIKEYDQLSKQQAERDHKVMAEAVKNLNKTR